ncbi:MAG: hypothetical protein JW951_00500 [Lentisphaerae bacterium]|nr:hypothetical protein [Lentisphaerota bacterium]
MKTPLLHLTVAVFLTVGSMVPLRAQIAGAGNEGRRYLAPMADLSRWSAGFRFGTRERDVTTDSSIFVERMKRTTATGHVGYRPLRWLTAYALLGGSWTRFGAADYGDMEPEVGFGLAANLLDHDIMAPALFEDRIKIDVGCHYAMAQTDTETGRSLDWNEVSAQALFTLVNDVTGSKLYSPYSIGLFVGPVYSALMGDVEEEDALGATAGLQVFSRDRVSFTLGVEYFDAESFFGGINVDY